MLLYTYGASSRVCAWVGYTPVRSGNQGQQMWLNHLFHLVSARSVLKLLDEIIPLLSKHVESNCSVVLKDEQFRLYCPCSLRIVLIFHYVLKMYRFCASVLALRPLCMSPSRIFSILLCLGTTDLQSFICFSHLLPHPVVLPLLFLCFPPHSPCLIYSSFDVSSCIPLSFQCIPLVLHY